MNEKTIEALRSGNKKAFEEIFIAYFGKVKYFIQGILKSEEDAEELTQDVFVRFWEKRRTIDPHGALNAYIYKMARNAAFNFLRSKLIHQTYIQENTFQELQYTTEEQLIARETTLLVEMTVSRMPAQRQTIYRMSRNDGIPNEEIALRLGIAKKTVENQLSLALRELRGVVVYFFLSLRLYD